MKLYKTVADSDLEIRGEPGHPDPEITGGEGGGTVSKKMFQPFLPQFGLTIRGGGWGGRPLPWIHNCKSYC